jgi:hypothetical protein
MVGRGFVCLISVVSCDVLQGCRCTGYIGIVISMSGHLEDQLFNDLILMRRSLTRASALALEFRNIVQRMMAGKEVNCRVVCTVVPIVRSFFSIHDGSYKHCF